MREKIDTTSPPATKEQKLRALAKKAAHDLRVPIAAIQTVAELATGLSDEERQLLSDAVVRIQGIANACSASQD